MAADVPAAGAELYQRLANVLENAADFRAAAGAYQEAYDSCLVRGADAAAQVCLICLAYVQWQTGDWERAARLSRQVIASPAGPAGARLGATGLLGILYAARGDAARARGLLAESLVHAEANERQRLEIGATLGLAWVDELEGDVEAAATRCHLILTRWGESESRHYPLPALRWAATFLARHGAEREARACAEALARTAAATPSPEALGALAHALGETALLDGEPEQAVIHFGQALEFLRRLELPYETAQTQVRAGVALARAGERETAIDRFVDAYRTARKLKARPLAAQAAEELAALGEPVDRRLGRQAAAQLEHGGLTRRELEVIRLVAVGRTNREIARELFLSPRTVEMHVRNILAKLGCRSRAEATHRAGELGLVGGNTVLPR